MYPVKSDYLFVYSSLLKGFSSPDYEYITQYFDLVGTAKTPGQLSIKDSIVVGTPPVDHETFIVGELYKIKEQDLFSFAIGQLDEYEGVHPEPPAKPIYYRSITTVTLEDGEMITAWVYWYNGSVHGLPILESGNVLEFLNRNK